MKEPKWLEEIASYSKVSEYPPYTDTVAQLLAHIKELREALGLVLECQDLKFIGHDGVPPSLYTLLNRQEPPEVK